MHVSEISEEQALAVYQQLMQQWNKRNAAAMAGLFATNGTLIGFDGSQLNGQKEIYAIMEEIFGNFPTAAYISIVKEIRSLGSGSAMLLAVAGMVAQGHTDISPAVNAVQTLIVTTENGQPRIALFQNTPAAFHGRPELSEQLSADLRAVLVETMQGEN